MSKHAEAVSQGADVHERIEWLERELEREREEVRRSNKLFLVAANYVDSMRQRARGDAELTLKKARERAAQVLGGAESERRRAETELQRVRAELRLAEAELTRADAERRQAKAELRQAEAERTQAQAELVRLQSLTDETRAKLSAFTTAALRVLNADVDTAGQRESGQEDAPDEALGDLRDALQPRLGQANDALPPLPSTAGGELFPGHEGWNGHSASDHGVFEP
jgi:cell division septum initiation protein DivIVA